MLKTDFVPHLVEQAGLRGCLKRDRRRRLGWGTKPSFCGQLGSLGLVPRPSLPD